MKEYDQNENFQLYKVHEVAVNVEQYEVDVEHLYRLCHYFK
jgi:hypothetical protein